MKKQDAIQFFGSATKLARALNIDKSSVSQWGEEIPPLRAYQINEIIEKTGGKLKVSPSSMLAAASEHPCL